MRSFGREYALVYRAGLPNKTGSFEVTLRDKLNNFAHLLSEAEIGNIPPICWRVRQHGFKDRMNSPFGDVKCISTLKSIAPSYWTNAIDRGYRTDNATAFLTRGDPASDELAPDNQALHQLRETFRDSALQAPYHRRCGCGHRSFRVRADCL